MKQYHAVSKPGSIRLSIPQPCNEDWNKMTPQEQGRYCSSCRKCVVDFTSFTDRAIYEYIIAHKNEHICGRFYKSQLNRAISIPPQPHSRLYMYFVGLGLTLMFTQLPIEQVRAQTIYTHKTEDKKQNNKHPKDQLSVRILDSISSKPIYRAIVHITKDRRDVARGETDKNGYFYFDNKGDGTYIILARDWQSEEYKTMNVRGNSTAHTTIVLYRRSEDRIVIMGGADAEWFPICDSNGKLKTVTVPEWNLKKKRIK